MRNMFKYTLIACNTLISSISHYLFFWKDFLCVVHIFHMHQWSATSVVSDCPLGPSLPVLNHFLFVCLDLDACMQLKTADQVDRACAHFTVSDGEAKMWGISFGGISKRSYSGIPQKNESAMCFRFILWSLWWKRPSNFSILQLLESMSNRILSLHIIS